MDHAIFINQSSKVTNSRSFKYPYFLEKKKKFFCKMLEAKII